MDHARGTREEITLRAWYCCIDAAVVVSVHCSNVLDVQRLNLSAGCAHRLCYASNMCMYTREEPSLYMCNFLFSNCDHPS